MKVLFITLSTFDTVGGIQSYNKNFIEALNLNELPYKVISYCDKGKDLPDGVYTCKSRLFYFIKLLRAHCDSDTIVVAGHIAIASLLKLISFTFSSKKTVLITHGTEVWKSNLTILRKYSIKKVDEIWVVSDYTRRRLVKVHNLENKLFRKLSNSIHMLPVEGLVNPFDLSKFNVLTVLRLDKSDKLKAVYNIIDSMSIIIKNGVNMHFTIVGTGNYDNIVKEYIVKSGLISRVTMTGFVESTAPYFHYCDIFTLISDGEGFGIVYLEAMMHKKACISAKSCGSDEVVIDGFTGVSVEVDDIDGIANSILCMKKKYDMRNMYGSNGYDLLLKKFTFDTFVKNQKKLILKAWK